MPLGQILDLRVKPVVIAQRRLKGSLIMPMTPHMDIAGKLETFPMTANCHIYDMPPSSYCHIPSVCLGIAES